MRAQSNRDALDLAIGIKDEAKKAAVLAALAEYSVHAAAFVGKADLVAAAIANGADVNSPRVWVKYTHVCKLRDKHARRYTNAHTSALTHA